MTEPTRVAVVRPKKSGAQAVGYLIGGFLGSLLIGWLLMLIVGTVTPWHLSYWHTLLVLYAIRVVQVGPGWMRWTHSHGKGSYL